MKIVLSSAVLAALFAVSTGLPQKDSSFPTFKRQSSEVLRSLPIRTTGSCPSDQPECVGAPGSRACCPSETTCYWGSTYDLGGKYSMIACCLADDTRDECFSQLRDSPVCSKPEQQTAWVNEADSPSLITNYPFCCANSELGLMLQTGYAACAADADSVPARASYVTRIPQATKGSSKPTDTSSNSNTNTNNQETGTSTFSSSLITSSTFSFSPPDSTRVDAPKDIDNSGSSNGGSSNGSSNNGGSSNGGSTTTTTTTTTGETKSKSSTNIGAIAGAVCGTIALIALLFFAWKVYKHRAARTAATGAPVVAGGALGAVGGRNQMAELDQSAGVMGGRVVVPVPKNPPPYVMPADRAELENEVEVRRDRTGRVSPILVNQSYRTPEQGPVVEADGRPVSK